jgi:D-alanine--poly(phosphoribitol) ligase subunit 2
MGHDDGRDGASMTVGEKVLDVLASVAETDEVRHDPDLRLYELHILDSLATVGLMVAFGDEFGVDISPAEFERDQWATPRLIVADIERRIAS